MPIALDQSSPAALLRDVIIRIGELTSPDFLLTDAERVRRIRRLAEAAIEADPVIQGFLGRGGPEAHRDILGGSGSLT